MKQAVEATRYWLAAGVSICRSDDYFVLLDGRDGQYLGVRAAEMHRVGEQIEGWPWKSESLVCEEATTLEQEATELLAQLIRRRILTRERSVTPQFPAVLEPAQQALIQGYEDVPYRISSWDVWNFLRAAVTAAGLLRCCSFERLVARMRSRRTRLTASTCRPVRGRLEEARTRVAAFQALRPMLFGRAGACLLNSVALAEFLSWYGLSPDVVFGVKTAPFGAHCWLQQEGVVFNDIPEQISGFTPILVI